VKPVILAVTNDIVNDRRIFRIGTSLQQAGYPLLVVGRRQRLSLALSGFPFASRRFRLIFKQGFLFYATFNIRLFIFLLFHRASLLVANDLDTLLPVYLISQIKKIPLIYDTHEFFTGVPEVENRPMVKKVWLGIEKRIFPKLDHVTTVNGSIARLYCNMYNVQVCVIRNLSLRHKAKPLPHEELQLPGGKKMIILQGTGINLGRGAEEAVLAMEFCDDVILFIVGDGNALPKLRQQVADLNLDQKVRFISTLPYSKMMRYTASSALGISLDKPDYLNFKLSLPNKLFDYIQAGIPVLVSNLPEVAGIVREYKLGEVISSHKPREIADRINAMVHDQEKQKIWRQNARKAAQKLCWEEEEKKLIAFYKQICPLKK